MKTNENGRSLTEMLGTLAIMGIITVTGISAFRYGINKHQANTILSEAQMQATLLAGRILSQGLPENTTLENMSYTFSYKKESDVGYSLNLSGIDKGVCDILKNHRDLGWAETVLINNGENCKEDNSVAFYVNTDMTTEVTNEDRIVPCQNNADCGECGTCSEQNVCVPNDDYCTQTYASDKPYCNVRTGVCQKCEVGKFYNSTYKRCDLCSFDDGNIYHSYATASECQACPNRLHLSNNMCLSCDTKKQIPTNDVSICSQCPNRYVAGYSYCNLCEGEVSDDHYSCDFHCAPGYVGTMYGCQPCNSTEQRLELQGRNRTFAKKDCEACSNRTYREGNDNISYKYCALNCSNEGEFLDADGYCRSCDSNSFYIGWIYGNNRPEMQVELLNKCNECPNMIPDNDDNKHCVNLNSTTTTLTINATRCQEYFKGKRYVSGNNKCTLCPSQSDTDAWNTLTAEQQEQCTPVTN